MPVCAQAVARIAGMTRFHPGTCALFEHLAASGYNLLYLSSRPIGMAARTLRLLAAASEGSAKLPRGAVILSPTRTMENSCRGISRRRRSGGVIFYT